MRGTRIGLLVAAVVVAVGTAVTPTAAAASACPDARSPVLVGSVPGAVLEGAAVDGAGRMYVTDLVSGRVFRLDRPGAPAVPIATVPSGGAGALAWARDGSLLVGYGADARVFTGDATRAAGIVAVDVNSGAVRPFARGLSAANGLAVARDGTVYATNDFGSLVGRVLPNGVVQPDWAVLPSANGAALSADDRYLYVSRTFTNPGVSRIPTANPGAPESVVTFTGGDVFAAPDGLTLDPQGRPIVPTDVSGQILRVDGPDRFCVLASGMPMSSVVTYGNGDAGFSTGRLFRAGFDGQIFEV
ncbi:SMP-30/gluconolactonase/LRE family protein [Rhodococcus sp. Q]|uniref:SMP-30/gluconolactonase/LRE family protein n=1 Tax=Rhodococcus sp. Q TaxID=2502252 RepID=UPI0010F9A83C|nr:SMP-30/gluconolactonase/LRE family protein [Rhodococcus sp. Q]